jgi:hypothetical protein
MASRDGYFKTQASDDLGQTEVLANPVMEAIILIGIQGSGKTAFCERFFDTHVRISLDLVKTRHRERALLETCVRTGEFHSEKKSCLYVRSSHHSENACSFNLRTDVVDGFSLFLRATSCNYRRENRSARTENLPEAVCPE